MLVVIADVECYIVHSAVVGVRLEALLEHVVLGYEVTRDWVETHREESTPG